MIKIDINDLPEWSPWPSRLLGINQWNLQNRTINKVNLEYDKNKYAKCLEYYYRNAGSATPESIKQFEIGQESLENICVSHGNDLMLGSFNEALSKGDELLIDNMGNKIEQNMSVVELGCGYGYNLWMLKQYVKAKQFIGGEYSKNAVQLASDLFRDDSMINVMQLNFYDKSYGILEGINQPLVLFTRHAIEQLPDSTCFFEALLRFRKKISAVFHFEPVFELHDSTLLGLMRKRYTEVNDYNRDLLSQLKKRSDCINIVDIKPDVFGLNPLNPTSIIHWKFL